MTVGQLPGLNVIKQYQRSWLRNDLVAGVVLTTLLVPQGMAYAELAGLPVITGLYTTILCMIGYAIFGPSRILVLGPDSSLGPMIAATILPIVGADGSPERAVALASMLAIITGIVMLTAGIAKLGFVADLLSKPTQVGYMNGLALTILIGQLPKLFGFSVSADGLIGEARAFIHGITSSEAIGAAVVIGLASLAVILILEQWLPKIPGVLVAVLLAIVASAVFNLGSHGVSLVGTLPKGFPPLTLPSVSDLPLLIAGAIGIALVALTDTISTASAFAARSGQEVNGNGEMIGIGAANVAAGFFQGFPVSTSGSRTAVAEQAGAKSQVTGIVGALLIILMLLFVPGLLRNLPQPTLAAVVIAASLSLADIPATRRLWQIRRSEFYLTMAAFLGVALLGVLQGIAIAVALSILNMFYRAWWPHQARLGRATGIAGYHDEQQYPKAKELPGLIIVRFDAPLFFANARAFKDQVRKYAREDPRPKWILLAAEPITDIDTTAAEILENLNKELQEKDITLVFSELKDPVRDRLKRYGLLSILSEDQFYPTLDDAIEHYRHQTGADWVLNTKREVTT